MDLPHLHWPIVGILTLFPIVALIASKGANASFYVLLLLSLMGIASRCKPAGKRFGEILREYWPINLAMMGLACATFLNQLSTGHFISRAYDMPSRLAGFAFLFWILLLVPGKDLKKMQWGLIGGALIGTLVLYIGTAAGAARPLRLFNIPINPFGNITLLMGAMALLSIGWNARRERALIALKLVAGAAALYGSYLSQTRGGWVAIPLFAAVALALLREIRLHHKLAFFVLGTVVLCSTYTFSSAIQKRIDEGLSDITQYVDKQTPDTSVGIRLQLWRGSWLLFAENPLFGVGREQYPHSMQRLVARGEVTAGAAAHPHSHNEILFHAATLGMGGLLAILSLYFVPAFYFLREMNHPDRETRTVAAMGLALTLGFFIFGLTDVMFYWTVSYTFYGVMLPALFVHLVKRKAFSNSMH